MMSDKENANESVVTVRGEVYSIGHDSLNLSTWRGRGSNHIMNWYRIVLELQEHLKHACIVDGVKVKGEILRNTREST